MLSRTNHMSTDEDITGLLMEWKAGNDEAGKDLIPIVYQELRGLAERYLRNERDALTLQPTALVHEAYLRLVQHKLPDWQSRAHFVGVASYLMRQLLVERARRHHAEKRGGGVANVPFDEALSFAPERSASIIALDGALNALAQVDQRKGKIIELRYFGGLSIEEIAQAMDLSIATVGREQRLAVAWLHREMQPPLR